MHNNIYLTSITNLDYILTNINVYICRMCKQKISILYNFLCTGCTCFSVLSKKNSARLPVDTI